MNSSNNIVIPTKNQKCIVNTDLDGIFSGLILHNTLNWEIVGFCDSAESIWIDKNRCNNLKECTFIDMFVHPEDIRCIDQHIISVDEEHINLLSQNKNKLNPNLINKRSFLPNKSYYKKYPFGTVHFIIAWLERNGVNVEIDLLNNVSDDIKIADLLLRADDTFQTSTYSNYVDNAQEWWLWLEKFSNKGKMTMKLKDYIFELKNKKTKTQLTKIKQTIADLLKSKPFYCDSPDGGYKSETSLGSIFLKPNVKEYINFIADRANLNCFNLDFSFSILKGNAKRSSLTSMQMQNIKEGHFDKNLFSYAFVRSNRKSNSFSYTLMEYTNLQ